MIPMVECAITIGHKSLKNVVKKAIVVCGMNWDPEYEAKCVCLRCNIASHPGEIPPSGGGPGSTFPVLEWLKGCDEIEIGRQDIQSLDPTFLGPRCIVKRESTASRDTKGAAKSS